MRLLAAILLGLAAVSLASAYELSETREEMLLYYYSNIEDKIPKSARMLVGDEKINVYLGGKVIGIETKYGKLSTFELEPVEKPGIIIVVSDYAAQAISARKMGILEAIDKGEIRIQAKNLFSLLKVEAAKRIYAVSGADKELLGEKKPSQADAYNSVFVQRAKIWNWMH